METIVMAPESFQWQQPSMRVDVAALERELDRLFHEGGAFTRAGMLNLVAVCTCGEEVSRVMETATRIVAHHPARVLLLDFCGDGGETEDVSATLSATCFRSGPEGKQVCCEVIILKGGGADPHPIISAVLALLVPDLPVILWWSGEADLRSPLFDALRPFLDGMVFDSRRLLRRQEDFPLLVRLLGGAPAAPWVGDLAWFRLAPWRILTAQVFDPPECRGLLPGLQEIRLLFEGGASPTPATFSDPLLYAAWFSGTLGWDLQEPLRPDNEGAHRAIFRTEGGAAVVILERRTPRPDPIHSPGTLLEAAFRFQSGEKVRTCWMGLDPEGTHLVSSMPEEVLLPPTRSRSEMEESVPSLLCQALEEIGRTGTYPRAIETVTRMVVL
ncbi:MAG: glucose-6-phosphate dehydrogenase assembly protein OpcA [Nitrospirae bacterium]|nr:glucose-6-phosphate dehydrogenase assembly protein OpcA [Nitrospirota bacterium]